MPCRRIEATGALDVRALSPRRGRAPTLVRLAALRAWSARRITSWSVDGLGGLGHHDARAEIQAQDAAVVAVVLEAAHHVLRHHAPLLERRVEEDDGEGRPAVSRDVVVAAEPASEHGRDLAQDQVAGPAVEPLVDPAEVVRPEEEQDGGQTSP